MPYSKTILDHFGNPRNIGPPSDYQARGTSGKQGGGPFMVLYLGMQESSITSVGFETYGCGPAIAAGSLITEWVKSKSIDQASKMTSEKLIEMLGGLPLSKRHCADLAVNALRSALTQLSKSD